MISSARYRRNMFPHPKSAGNMNNRAALHHVEMCVSNGRNIVSYFTEKLGFSLRACRNTPLSKQWVVGSQRAVFLVTQRLASNFASEPVDFSQFCCDGNHSVDSVFNVALEVKDVDNITAKMQKHGARLLQPVTNVSDSLGSVRYSVISSCCGNIIHTLLDKSKYKGDFLPSFNSVCSEPTNQEIITHMDHITYVCHPGESSSIIDWYQACLGMKKFKVNPSEDLNEGLIIRGKIGMRLRVIDYWPCAEVGIYHPDENEESSLKIVLAESLEDQENLHISAFLNGHGGPGLQHIGLHTSCITQCVDYMSLRNVLFRKSPTAYYRNEKIKSDIKEAGFDVEKFQKSGILIDSEADASVENDQNRFLLQIFTLPIFEQETFFLEMVQRQGARGFGSGNVTALARSIEEEQVAISKKNHQLLNLN